jgi:hypothetical protein
MFDRLRVSLCSMHHRALEDHQHGATFGGIAPFTVTVNRSVEMTAVSAAVLGNWPIAERWSLDARGSYEVTDSESILMFDATRAERLTDSSGNVVVGVGVDFAVTPRWSLRAAAERHLDVGGEVFTSDVDTDVYRLAVLFAL